MNQYGYNSIIICGTLHDIQVKDKHIKFTIIEKYKMKETDGNRYHKCLSFSADINSILNEKHNGLFVTVIGNVQYGSYETKDGIKIYTTDFFINRIVGLNTSGTGSNSSYRSRTNTGTGNKYNKEDVVVYLD